jgi:hypothetical protein
MTSGRAESLDERERLCKLKTAPLVTASPTDVLVSTSPSKSELIASGPFGTTATRSSSSEVASSVHASVGVGYMRDGDRQVGIGLRVGVSDRHRGCLDRGTECGLALKRKRRDRCRLARDRVPARATT